MALLQASPGSCPRAARRMNASHVYGEREHGADHSVIAELQHRMEKLLDEMDKHAPAYAKARQVLEFGSDRRKSALADAFAGILAHDPECSATAAEHRARASTLWKERMKGLTEECLNAETARTMYELLQTRLDVARSLLAVERAKLERGI